MHGQITSYTESYPYKHRTLEYTSGVNYKNHTFALLTLLSLEVVYKNGQITPNAVTHPCATIISGYYTKMQLHNYDVWKYINSILDLSRVEIRLKRNRLISEIDC